MLSAGAARGESSIKTTINTVLDSVAEDWRKTRPVEIFEYRNLIGQDVPVAFDSAIKQMLGKELQAPDRVWDNVNLGWVGFFTLCGLLNLYVAFNLSQEMWVNFKVFGLLGMTLVFTLLSGVYLYRHMPAEQNAEQKK